MEATYSSSTEDESCGSRSSTSSVSSASSPPPRLLPDHEYLNGVLMCYMRADHPFLHGSEYYDQFKANVKTDTAIVCNGESYYYVHWVVICSQWNHLKLLFDQFPTPEEPFTRVIRIDGPTLELFDEVIRFLYLGESLIPSIQRQTFQRLLCGLQILYVYPTDMSLSVDIPRLTFRTSVASPTYINGRESNPAFVPRSTTRPQR